MDKDDRENSDYEIYSAVDRQVAEKALEEAAAFYQESKKYLRSF